MKYERYYCLLSYPAPCLPPTVHFPSSLPSSLVSLLSLGVNLLGHNGNSQDGRMKVLIPRNEEKE